MEILISNVKAGAIIMFPNSACYYMKVYDRDGRTGVVRLMDGRYITLYDLINRGLGEVCEVIADNLDRFHYTEDEEQ